MHTFHIYRYDPGSGSASWIHDYEIEVGDSQRMLLDMFIQLDSTDINLICWRSSREGVCDSDGMHINGKNGLAFGINMPSLPKLAELKHRRFPKGLRPVDGISRIRAMMVRRACAPATPLPTRSAWSGARTGCVLRLNANSLQSSAPHPKRQSIERTLP